MENLTVAIPEVPLIKLMRYDFFQMIELFASNFNLSINYLIWKGCNYQYKTLIDSYMLDLEELKGCESGIQIPFVIEYQSLTILVPTNFKKPRSAYFLMPFDILIIRILGITISTFLFVLIFPTKLGKMDLSKEVLNAFGLQYCQTIQNNFKTNSILNYLYLFLSVFGFIIYNYYSVHLSSYLIKGINNNNITIKCDNKDLDFLKKFPRIYKRFEFSQSYRQNMVEHIRSLNVSCGICIRTGPFYKRFTSDMRNKNLVYRRIIPWIAGFDPMIVTILNRKSKYLKTLNSFILKMYSKGFMERWAQEMMVQNFSRKYREILEPDFRI